MLIVVPWPGALWIENLPRCRHTMTFSIGKPSQVPCSPLVVKNGSRHRARTSSGIPRPSSTTPKDHPQRVVEIVGDAAGHLPDRPQPLLLDHLLLGPLELVERHRQANVGLLEGHL